MKEIDPETIRKVVRENYSSVARSDGGCGCGTSSCCGQPNPVDSQRIGYSEEEMASVPEGANLGLGCGNPQAIAALKEGEIVLDLGSGAGFDAFLAAPAVGPKGKVIGVDMTPDMLAKARENAQKGDYKNVEFRLGEIEHLPVADNSVDVILSNCVINLSPDKPAVFADAFRVLKKGGRLAISDVVATAEIPESAKKELALYSSCVTGAVSVEEYTRMLQQSGFIDIRIQPKDESREFIKDWAPDHKVEDYVLSATIEAIKP